MEEGALNISHMAPASSHVGILLLLDTVHTWPMVGMAGRGGSQNFPLWEGRSKLSKLRGGLQKIKYQIPGGRINQHFFSY